MVMTEERIKELEKLGFRRWQKYGKDRLYISYDQLVYREDDGWYALGKKVDPSEGLITVYDCKTWIEVETEMLYSEHPVLGRVASEATGLPYEPDEYMKYCYDTFKEVYELFIQTARDAFPDEAKDELSNKLQKQLFEVVGAWAYAQYTEKVFAVINEAK